MTHSRPIKKLGEIVKITKGKKVNYFSDKKKYNYIDIGILRSNKIVEFTDDDGVSCKKEDILIAWDGSKSGTIGYGLEGIIGSTLAKLEITKNNIHTPYIGEFLKGQFEYINKNTSGAAIPHIRKEVLVGLEIPLPPLATQQLIVAKLDETFAQIDEAITTTQANIDQTDELTKSVLDKVFEEGEWEKKKFGEVCNFVRGPFGGSLKKEIFKLSGYAVYEQQHAIGDQFDSIRYFIDEDKFNEMKRFELKSGDLIMSCSGTMGKIAIVPDNIKKGIINQALLKLTPSSKISKEFLKLRMQSKDFQDTLNEYTQGAAIKNVASVAILKDIQIPLPLLAKQQEIVSYLDHVFAQSSQLKEQYQKKLVELKELKASVLQSAFDPKEEEQARQ